MNDCKLPLPVDAIEIVRPEAHAFAVRFSMYSRTEFVGGTTFITKVLMPVELNVGDNGTFDAK